MSPDQKKFYVTTPIYYVNARPHIGHAYTTIVADVLARRHRLLGEETFFLTGTDEHGQKIERSAAAAGIAPQQFTDEVSAAFRSLWDRMGLTYNRYIRTTDDAHKRGAQKLFSDLYHRGAIYLSSYTGQYSIGEEMFVEGPPGTLGPDGRPTETVTEENFFFRLSEFQRPLLDLIELDILKITPETSKNEVLSFLRGDVAGAERAARPAPSEHENEPPMSDKAITVAYSDTGHAYVPGAVRDLSVSRSSFTWGIPVPEGIQREAKVTGNHVIYVWLDALANYMTAIGYGNSSAEAQAEFARLWPADLHLVGKEITRFHCVYWPAFLLAAGLPLPRQITANGWLLFDNAKMSKSRGNIVRTETILDAFGDQVYGKQFPESTKAERDLFAADVLRYFLLREIPFGQDGSFSFDALVTRYNADLVNGYGNLVSRTLKLIEQSFSSKIPPHPEWLRVPISVVDETQVKVLGLVPDTELAKLSTVMIRFEREASLHARFSLGLATQQLLDDLRNGVELRNEQRGALDYITLLIAQTDAFISSNKPWILAKSLEATDRERLGDVLYQAADTICVITALLYPYIPHSAAEVWRQLGLGDIEAAAKSGELQNLKWGDLKPGTSLGPLSQIFPRADKGLSQIMTDIEETRAAAAPGVSSSKTSPLGGEPDSASPAAPPRTSESDPVAAASVTLPVAGSTAVTTGHLPNEPGAAASSASAEGPASATPGLTGPADAEPQIAIDDFIKVELRVAQILVAERIPKADKLLRLEVDLGYEKRQILSGIAPWYTPEELVGRRIAVVANLAPRKMRGLESHGMLLAASAGPDDKPVLASFGEETPLGARVR